MPRPKKRGKGRAWSFDNPRIRTLLLIGNDYAFVGPQVPYKQFEIPEDIQRAAWEELKDSLMEEHRRDTQERLKHIEESLAEFRADERQNKAWFQERDELKAELAQPGGPKPWAYYKFEETETQTTEV